MYMSVFFFPKLVTIYCRASRCVSIVFYKSSRDGLHVYQWESGDPFVSCVNSCPVCAVFPLIKLHVDYTIRDGDVQWRSYTLPTVTFDNRSYRTEHTDHRYERMCRLIWTRFQVVDNDNVHHIASLSIV